ncbi:hypothetical protein [Halomarina litorea]|uniref:hypothetical protein n=1 Tax=Halomarina litorea TaxID=2961595 RepID=UPI0020C39497|nr:hypothetical protein [Halomarina sp. BCD28]
MAPSDEAGGAGPGPDGGADEPPEVVARFLREGLARWGRGALRRLAGLTRALLGR